ncbi:MAG: NAD(P)H-dependent flavin oxidoreductase [Desulfatibacillaceae bacterium]
MSGLLGTRYPIILGPMRMITLGEMAGAVSACGGFGQIAASGLDDPADIRAEIEKARAITDRPVGVNIPVYRPNAHDALEAAIDMGVKAITTSAGNPAKIMDRARQAGLTVIHKVSSLKLAKKAADAGVDAVIAMGYEAGGHVGRENITTMCLVPQLVDALDIPVIAAGGIADARGVAAAFALGAEGVEMGTRFVATAECPVPGFFKEDLCSCGCDATLLLGKEAMPIRVLRNKVTMVVSGMAKDEADETIVQSGDAAYVMQGGTRDTAVMPCGQIAGLVCSEASIREVFDGIVREVPEVLARMQGLFGAGR